MLVHANLLLRVRPPWGLLRLLQLLRLLLRGNCVRVQGLYIRAIAPGHRRTASYAAKLGDRRRLFNRVDCRPFALNRKYGHRPLSPRSRREAAIPLRANPSRVCVPWWRVGRTDARRDWPRNARGSAARLDERGYGLRDVSRHLAGASGKRPPTPGA